MKKKIVIKLGGSTLQDSETLKKVATLVGGYRTQGFDVIIVHGGGPAINDELTLKDIKWQFINGQRQTTTLMMSVIEDVLASKVNSKVVASLREAGMMSVGLSGAQHKILFCKQTSKELMHVGTIEHVRTTAIDAALKFIGRAVPVIAPIGIGVNGEKYNVNADWAAAHIATALGASKLIFLTDQAGILDENKKLVRKTNASRIDKMIDQGVIFGGMFTKVRAMTLALEGGVKQVRVLHASSAPDLLLGRKQLSATGTLLTSVNNYDRGTHGRAS